MVQYNAAELNEIFSFILRKFANSNNDLEERIRINKETKKILDLICKLQAEELKKIKRRGWDIKEK